MMGWSEVTWLDVGIFVAGAIFAVCVIGLCDILEDEE